MLRKQTYSHLISTMIRFRLGLIVTCCLLASISALLMTISRGSAAENACAPPGVTVVSDAANDQTAGVTGATASHDILSVSLPSSIRPAWANSW